MARRPEFYYDEKTGYYRKRLKLADGRWKDVRARSKDELRNKLYELETAQRLGIALDDSTTVAELSAEWFNNRKAGLSTSRQEDYRSAINLRICPVLGAMKIRDVKPEHCQRVMAACAQLSHSAQQKTVSAMKQIFACAVDNGLIFRSPAEKIKPGGAKPKEKDALTPEQCAQLEHALKGTRAYVPVMLGLYAGLRREEICGLQWRDIDLKIDPPRLTVNNAVRFEGNKAVFPSPLKSKAAHRTIPLTPKLAEALREEKRNSNSVFVIHDRDGQCVSQQALKNIVAIINRRAPKTEKQLAKRAEQEKELGRQIREPYLPKDFNKIDFRPTLHQLRHTYITRLILAGLDVKRVQNLAGHDDVRMTLNVYSHVAQNKPEDLIASVTAALEGPTPAEGKSSNMISIGLCPEFCPQPKIFAPKLCGNHR